MLKGRLKRSQGEYNFTNQLLRRLFQVERQLKPCKRLTRLKDAVDLLVGWARDLFDSRTVKKDLADLVPLI